METHETALEVPTGGRGLYAAYTEYAGQGFEQTTISDYRIPFLSIVQAMSPSVNDGAVPGQISIGLNSTFVSGKTGVLFVPAVTRRLFVEWQPRELGGKFCGHYQPDDEIVKKAISESTSFGKYKNGVNSLVETFYVYGLIIDENDNLSESAIAFSSTRVRPYRIWMTQARSTMIQVSVRRSVVAPLFSYAYRFMTVLEKNNLGQYYNWKIKQEIMITPGTDIFLMALSVRDMFNSGSFNSTHE